MPAEPSQPLPYAASRPPRNPLLRAATYPALYTWYIFFASLDIMITWLILHAGGREENALADWIIRQFNLPGVVTFKFLMVILVIAICEIIGRYRQDVGMRVARWAVILSAFPVVVGVGQLLIVALAGPDQTQNG